MRDDGDATLVTGPQESPEFGRALLDALDRLEADATMVRTVVGVPPHGPERGEIQRRKVARQDMRRSTLVATVLQPLAHEAPAGAARTACC